MLICNEVVGIIIHRKRWHRWILIGRWRKRGDWLLDGKGGMYRVLVTRKWRISQLNIWCSIFRVFPSSTSLAFPHFLYFFSRFEEFHFYARVSPQTFHRLNSWKIEGSLSSVLAVSVRSGSVIEMRVVSLIRNEWIRILNWPKWWSSVR